MRIYELHPTVAYFIIFLSLSKVEEKETSPGACPHSVFHPSPLSVIYWQLRECGWETSAGSMTRKSWNEWSGWMACKHESITSMYYNMHHVYPFENCECSDGKWNPLWMNPWLVYRSFMFCFVFLFFFLLFTMQSESKREGRLLKTSAVPFCGMYSAPIEGDKLRIVTAWELTRNLRGLSDISWIE